MKGTTCLIKSDYIVVLEKVKQYLGFGFIYFQNEKRLNHSSRSILQTKD